MSRALVVSGGGCKGAFAVGLLKTLFAQWPNLAFDMYVGTSTGSLVTPLVAMNEMALLEQIYTTVTTQDIVLPGRIGDRIDDVSIFDASPLWNLIQTNYTDARYQNLLASGRKLFINTTCLQASQLVVFTNDPAPGNSENYAVTTLVNADHFRRAVMASACQPVFMQPITVNENVPGDPNPTFQFVDGGVKEYVGIQMAIDNGATEIFTILLSPEAEVIDNESYSDLLTILQTTISIFSDNVDKDNLLMPKKYNDALVYIAAVKANMIVAGISSAVVEQYFNVPALNSPYQDKPPINFFTFQPTAPLGGGPGGLTFDPVEMATMIQAGVVVANNFIATVNPAEVTWN
jgi:NTE family protein